LKKGMERREAPAEAANLRQAGVACASLAPRFRDPSESEGWRGPGARGPLRGAPAPPGAPSRHALSAAAPCSVVGRRDRRRPRRTKALDLALDESTNQEQ